LACRAGDVEPLDLFVHEPKRWEEWNKYKGQDEFSRDYIFALIDFWPEQDRWLFGGAWQIHDRKYRKYKNSYWEYDISLLEACKPFIGRLKLSLKRPARNKALYFEDHYSKLVVTEILPTRYAGEVFCGFDVIDIEFSKLADIIRRQQSDWRTALENVKGVYLITDTRNEKRYVGSAYSEGGIWSRWACHINTGHGYTADLKRVISKRGPDYARKFFRFALLEHFSMKTDNDFIISREAYWKEVLRSRGKYGYNKN
jgi:hypothetical protein